jgi:hypothetical protein
LNDIKIQQIVDSKTIHLTPEEKLSIINKLLKIIQLEIGLFTIKKKLIPNINIIK